MTWLELGTSGPTAFTGEAQLMSQGWKVAVAHGAGASCRENTFLLTAWLKLDHQMAFSTSLPLDTRSRSPGPSSRQSPWSWGVWSIFDPLFKVFFFFYFALWMHISIKHVVGGGRWARVKIHSGRWRQRLGGCERMVDAFLRLWLDSELWMTHKSQNCDMCESENAQVSFWLEVELHDHKLQHLHIIRMIILQSKYFRFERGADLVF